MFCDLVGSTELSSRLDPEDLNELIRAYQARVAKTIGRYGGFIARYMGDGVLVYFGWPEAGENDAERAVHAALATADAITAAPVRTEKLQVRIGIATGLVSSAIRSARANPASRPPSARRRIVPPGCRPSRHRAVS
jgi:class 3 adenylate cyclase